MSKTLTRKSNRLKEYDYTRRGYYFVTICAYNYAELFGTIENNQMILNDAGNMVNFWWIELPVHFSGIELNQYIIMPSHIHAIINISVGVDRCVDPIQCADPIQNHKILNNGRTRRSAPTISTIIQWFKTMTTNKYIYHVKNDNWKPFNKHLWQRSFYDYIIRNDKSLNKIRKYIVNNPTTWAEDKENTNNINIRRDRCRDRCRDRSRPVRYKKKTGFTIMEMMVTLTLFTIIMGVVFGAFKLGDTYRNLISVQIKLNRQSKRAHDAVSADLSLSTADAVSINDANPDELKFQVPLADQIDVDYNIPWGADNTTDFYIKYYITGNHLIREILDNTNTTVGGTQETIASGVIDLQFSPVPADNPVTMNITFQKNMRSGRIINFTSSRVIHLSN